MLEFLRARFKDLLKRADQEGAAAAQDAHKVKKHAEEYQTALKEAELHGDRHEQLWHEAQECALICVHCEPGCMQLSSTGSLRL